VERNIVKGELRRLASMKRYTSMKVGGPVPFLVYPRDEGDVVATVKWLRREGLPVRFLGNGTNVIVADRGIMAGLIRVTRMRRLRFTSVEGKTTVEAGGGFPLKSLIKECARRGYSGLEKLYGIPGTVGGAVKMNAGSFGVTVTDSLASVRLVDADGAIRTLKKEEMKFGYRTSSIRMGEGVLEAAFDLVSEDPARIRNDMDYVWQQRLLKHPMNLPSAGSIFKNTGPMPCWKHIDLAGLRGLRIGGAAVCEKHANFIVNTGNATAAEVRELIDTVKKGVRERTGVLLEEEVELWGF
jgi:UDP-N-acetylmuramate dehydrogenase